LRGQTVFPPNLADTSLSYNGAIVRIGALMKTTVLAIEFVLLFLLPPLLIAAGTLPKNAIMPLLWAEFFYAWFILRRAGVPLLLRPFRKSELRRVIERFAVFGLAILLFTVTFYPEKLFSLVYRDPLMWASLFLLYPLFSVLAQEVVIRLFFFHRYGHLIADERRLILFNALVFAYIHIAFTNPLAVLFSFAGGVLFAHTFLKTGSTALVSIEHTLYGNTLFTVGLGTYFYHGSSQTSLALLLQ
jgi:hypothetical protein